MLASNFTAPPHWRTWLTLVVLTLATLATGCASLPREVQRTASSALATPEDTPLGQMVEQRRAREARRGDSGFCLIDSADLAYAARLALVESATRTLDLQYYAIHADDSTRELMRALRAAAARGVRVRILLDDFNSVERDALVLRLTYLPNVEIRLFNPLPGSRHSAAVRLFNSLHDFQRIQHRMHNKLFIADNAIGITGGRNLGESYFGQATHSNFIDMDVLAAGRVVRDMSDSFDRYWNHPMAYPVEALIDEDELDALRRNLRQGTDRSASESGAGAPVPASAVPAARPDLPPAIDLSTHALVWAPSVLMADQPAKLAAELHDEDPHDSVVDGLLGLMQAARNEVLIVTPYFVPGPRMMEVLAGLRERGVRVRALTNSLASTDAPLAHVGYARYRARMLALGVELHEMRARQPRAERSAFGSSGRASQASLHAKIVVVDGRIVVIGSMNLDLRSQRQNSEVALLVRSRQLARSVAQAIEPTLRAGAWQLTLMPDRSFVWKAPPEADFKDSTGEPDARPALQLLLQLIGRFAPDEML